MPTTRRTRSLGIAALAFALLAAMLLPATLAHADDPPSRPTTPVAPQAR